MAALASLVDFAGSSVNDMHHCVKGHFEWQLIACSLIGPVGVRRVGGATPKELQSTRGQPLYVLCLTSTAVFLFQGNSERKHPSSTRLPKRNAKWRTVRRQMGWLADQVKKNITIQGDLLLRNK